MRIPAIRIGIPIGFCAIGLATLWLPGATPLLTCAGWLLAYLIVAIPYSRTGFATRTGSWTLWAASLAMTAGIIVNCHYYICVWGHGLPDSPVLMNLDAWSAWNNALADLGRDDAMRCHWPAVGYGHLTGVLLGIIGTDICVPLMFNMLCALATIALTGYTAAACCPTAPKRYAETAMLLAYACCYFIASAAVLIKDCPLAASVALCAYAAVSARRRPSAINVLALIAATVITAYCRPNYLLVLAAVIVAMNGWSQRHSRIYGCGALAVIMIVWIGFQYSGTVASISNFIDLSGRSLGDESGRGIQHSLYFRLFNDYYSFSTVSKLLLLPVTTAIQFLIPFPWTYDKYLLFGPFMALAHFSFGRYAVGGLVFYFLARLFKHRAPQLLLRLTATGIFFYCASALQFGGTVSRYGIPLVALLVPCAAYSLQTFRKERAFRIWAAVFSLGMAATLIICYHLTT